MEFSYYEKSARKSLSPFAPSGLNLKKLGKGEQTLSKIEPSLTKLQRDTCFAKLVKIGLIFPVTVHSGSVTQG